MTHRFATPDSAALDWPAAFGRRFVVTIDTEEEFDWSSPGASDDYDVTAIAALPAMHERLRGHRISPIYMVDYVVASNEAAAATLRDLLARDPASAIGAQLHSWVTPPLGRGARVETFAGNLPREIEAAKLDRLIAMIERALGRRPCIYRAGRYGVGPHTFHTLASRGFRIDASMRARFDYAREGGSDFTAVGPGAFTLGDGALVELPLTTIYTGLLRAHGAWLHPLLGRVPKARGAFARSRLLSRVPLTPEGTPAAEAICAIEQAAADGERLLQLTFHSPSLVPGHTPYVRDARGLVRFHAWWDDVLPTLARCGYAPVTLDEIIAALGEMHAVGPAGLEPAT
ncbi:WalW protein [uncultured Sphingomonas sp.]|uniref:WalW protein n=1 Tax=uncultured Sphingomonas sp. TaxID=158754 RepID=UPI0025D39094|nr:WalW protein [uncultured Sphingomonas sp.]